MARALLLIAIAGCAHAAAPAMENVQAPPASCTVAVDMTTGAIAIDGVALPDFAVPRLRAVLGAPDRVLRDAHDEDYEEFGGDGMPPTSTQVPVTDHAYVYDRRGLVFVTRNGAFGSDATPTQLLVFLAHPRQFDNTAAPMATPRSRGGCALAINGQAVDPEVDLRPRGVTYRTDAATIFGVTVGFTSIATEIDRIYSMSGKRSLMIYLDAAATGRASYVEIR
ncbi:MAG: hypothetical protein K8W52_26080 [Deltaproteobacteria bacterium]|nr:hypothetical protein [Deltaproteobacteria bacterium]